MCEDTHSEDRAIICRDCQQPFIWPSGADPRFVALVQEKGWPPPVRCKACSLAAKRRVRDATTAPPSTVTLACRSCDCVFRLTPAEIAWFRGRALDLPQHCERCRRERRDAGPGVARALSIAEQLAE
jgi:hypothetical protein